MFSAYIFYGPESGERQRAIDNIQSELRKTHGDGLELFKYYAGEDQAADIVSSLSNGALFSTHSLAIIHNAEELTKKQDIESWKTFLTSGTSDTTVIFSSEQTKLDKRLLGLVSEKAKKIFWELFDNQKEGWVINYLRTAGARITPEALELFLSLVENNTQEMKQELDKILLLYSGTEAARHGSAESSASTEAAAGESTPPPGSSPESAAAPMEIGEELIENYIYHSKEESVYTLFNAYARGDFPSALEILQKLRAARANDETAILIRMTWQLRQLASLSAIRDQRPLENADYLKAKVFGKKNQQRFAQLLGRLDSRKIQRHIASSAEFEMQLRQQKGGLHGHIIQMWLYSLFFPLRGTMAGRRDRRLFAVNPDRFG